MARPSADLATLAAAVVTAALLAAPTDSAEAGSLSVTLDPARTTIRWLLRGFPDTVHGTFRLDRGDLRFDPATGEADGCIRVDSRSGESGNRSRDQRMHDKILESGRYPAVILHPTRLLGTYPPLPGSELQVDGTLSLRDVEHPVTVPLRLAHANGVVTVDASMAIPYVAWGLPDPSVFIFRASKVVELDIHAVGSPAPATSPATHVGCGP